MITTEALIEKFRQALKEKWGIARFGDNFILNYFKNGRDPAESITQIATRVACWLSARAVPGGASREKLTFGEIHSLYSIRKSKGSACGEREEIRYYPGSGIPRSGSADCLL